MERTQILDLMGSLKLYGMRSAYDEVMAAGIKRQHEPPRIVGDRRAGDHHGARRAVGADEMLGRAGAAAEPTGALARAARLEPAVDFVKGALAAFEISRQRAAVVPRRYPRKRSKDGYRCRIRRWQ